MPRTNIPGVRRLSAGKAPRKILASKSGISRPKKGKGGGGRNPYKPRPTPAWQKKIKTFFPRGRLVESSKEDDDGAVPSSSVMLPGPLTQPEQSNIEKKDAGNPNCLNDNANSMETRNNSGAPDSSGSESSYCTDCDQDGADSEESSTCQ